MLKTAITESRVVVSVEQAAQQLGLGRSKTWELVRTGELRSVRAGRRVLVPVSALESFLQGCRVDNPKTKEKSPTCRFPRLPG